MQYFRSTGILGGLIFTRARNAATRERCSELLRLLHEADRAIADGSRDAAMRLSLVRDLVLATVGPVWVHERAEDPALTALQSARLAALTRRENAAAFDRVCSDVLGARFPAET